MQTQPLLLAGEALTTPETLAVMNPYTGARVDTVAKASPEVLARALNQLHDARGACARLSTAERYGILRKVAAGISNQREEFAQLIVAEAGKPLKYARMEVDRATTTFGLAGDYARTLQGELLNLDLRAGLEQRLGLVKRFPIGPVLAITPFNFPLNLVAHKLAPAMLAGAPILLKPASKTPLTALKLGHLLLEAGWPPEGLSVLPMTGAQFAPALADERVKVLSFTGSAEVGWALKEQAGRKRVVLELGGDAAVVVLADADLETAAQRCAEGAFAYAGQVCISVQRILVEEKAYEVFAAAFLKAVDALPMGDPANDATVVGPLIDTHNQERIAQWVDEALQGGAKVLKGGRRGPNNTYEPTVLQNIPSQARLANQEAFGPVVELVRVPDAEAALRRVNASRFGIQAGIFTRNEAVLKRAFHSLELGGIIANEVPTLRLDNMPYGGVKESGLGREGVRYAYEEFTEPRLLVW